ncbi:hypothetical protein ASF64_12975 [Arthrobacter sp. Leaf137]|nr:hypothetical protein ASF64_12975 [Arthrobacter sp. Leaf137]
MAFAAVFLGASLAVAVPASAHANLLFAAPAADSTVPAAPETLTLLFDQTVTTAGTPVQVTGPGEPPVAGATRLTHDGKALEVPITGAAGQGIYTVHWQVTATDGDVMSGSYRYAVGPSAAALGGGQTTETQGSWPMTVLRALLFTALALALGEQAGTRLLVRLRGIPPGPRPITGWACAVGLAAAAGLAMVLLGNGSLSEGLTRPDPSALTGSRPGILAVVELGGFALAAAAVAGNRRGWLWLPLTAVISAEAVRAHPQMAAPLLGIPLSMAHLAGACLWAGMLIHVLRTLMHWRHRQDLVRTALSVYSRTAVWLFAVVVLTGFGSALILVTPDSLLTTDYGRVLLSKTTLVAVVAALALAARRLLHKQSALEKIRRPARAEAAVLSVVLILSAVLTILPVPGSSSAPLAFPPPTTGPVVPAAALAGQIGINARASSGQLVIQLMVPETNVATPEPGLSGSLTSPEGARVDLDFRRCGPGCFFSPTTWADGTSRLTLIPTSRIWSTEPAALGIAWPAIPAEDMLREAVTAMKAVPAFTLHELVTSDTAKGLGTPRAFQTTGADFTRRALYASGEASIVNRLPDEDGNRRLVLSYPAENAVLELTLAPDGRILRETQTAPHHLVSHTLIYPKSPIHND